LSFGTYSLSGRYLDAKRRAEKESALLNPERPTLRGKYQEQTLSNQPQTQTKPLLQTASAPPGLKAPRKSSKGYFLRIKEHNVAKFESLAIRRFNESLIPSPTVTELAKYLLFKDLREASLNPSVNQRTQATTSSPALKQPNSQ